MLFTGCKTNSVAPRVLKFVQTERLANSLNQLINSDMQQTISCEEQNNDAYNFDEVNAFFIEVNTPEKINSRLDLVKDIRKINPHACIFVLITLTKSFSSTNFYLAGADHCIKIYLNTAETSKKLLETINNSHWKTNISLHLDRRRLVLSSATSKLEISYTEMIIIDALLHAPQHALSQDAIARTLDPNIFFYDPRALEKTISRLRTKIKQSYDIELIISIRTFGYRLRRCTVS